ncbi:MAG: bifunctional diaminohydroxyphosphoribosylaminopyrimidine deaminase/5-amino-6-(5-phosphoribosylamino)uracil reductase RibD [Thiotrichales bacterium]|nr:bifunctional diaminohydroxyphosphoribosylaminopyrimidine deaminase/5-amino-6-(5-phosphoribosylamino)uracil reductase RibD [Thiotrichales bacterium]
MAQAIRLAERGLFTVRPNPAVGCVIIDQQGETVGLGWHHQAGTPHAEVHALRMAGALAQGATAYVTLEPCSHHGRTPPCCDALVAAGVARVVIALEDPNPLVSGRGIARLKAAGVTVDVGLMASSARALNLGFLSRMERQQPFVRLKLAASLDGRTALANGQSKWITGALAREDVQRLRALSGAIITGINTVLVDDPSLTVRLPEFLSFQPLRVVLDSQLRMPETAQLFSHTGQILVVTLAEQLVSQPDKVARLRGNGALVEAVSRDETGRIDLLNLLTMLAQKFMVNDVLVEAGAQLAGAFMSAALVDELWWYTAPIVMGHDARAGLMMPEITEMDAVQRWSLLDQRWLGQDLRLRFKGGKQVCQSS